MSVRIFSRQEPRHKRMPKYIQQGAEVSMSGEIGRVQWIAGTHARVLFKDNSEVTAHYSWLRKPSTCAACGGDGWGGTYYSDGSPHECSSCKGKGLVSSSKEQA